MTQWWKSSIDNRSWLTRIWLEHGLILSGSTRLCTDMAPGQSLYRIGPVHSQLGFMEELPLADTFVDLWWQQFCPLRILLVPHVMPWEGCLISPLDVYSCLTQKVLPVLEWRMNSFRTATSSLGMHINPQNIQGPLFPTRGLSSLVAARSQQRPKAVIATGLLRIDGG